MLYVLFSTCLTLTRTRRYECECKTASAIATYGTNNLLCCMSFEDAGYVSEEPCTCLDGETESIACCENGNNFLPPALTELFDQISASEITGAIVNLIAPYMKNVVTEDGGTAFKKYNDKSKVAKWDWVAQGMGESAVKASGLYSTRDPIMYYNASEAGYPFRQQASIWDMCAGLVSQVSSCVYFKFIICQTSSQEAALLLLLLPRQAGLNRLSRTFCKRLSAACACFSYLLRQYSSRLSLQLSTTGTSVCPSSEMRQRNHLPSAVSKFGTSCAKATIAGKSGAYSLVLQSHTHLFLITVMYLYTSPARYPLPEGACRMYAPVLECLSVHFIREVLVLQNLSGTSKHTLDSVARLTKSLTAWSWPSHTTKWTMCCLRSASFSSRNACHD